MVDENKQHDSSSNKRKLDKKIIMAITIIAAIVICLQTLYLFFYVVAKNDVQHLLDLQQVESMEEYRTSNIHVLLMETNISLQNIISFSFCAICDEFDHGVKIRWSLIPWKSIDMTDKPLSKKEVESIKEKLFLMD